jgi:prepilin-type N-terminal cleavage/methylation domain-containing protein
MTRQTTGEDGFTMIEVLVAAMILVIAAMTTFNLLSSATRNAQRAKGTQVALDLAQQELERLHSMTNEELAMEGVPPHASSELDPGFRVNSGAGTFALQRSPVGEPQKMVYNESIHAGKEVKNGKVVPVEPFDQGDVSGKVYRYIVWRKDPRCTGCAAPYYKQIVVAVKLDSTPSQLAERGYVEVQSNFVDPTDSAETDPPAAATGGLTAQQFYLSDTPCAATGATDRQEITAEHLLHNTLGICANGLQNEAVKGAPDALLLGPPPDPTPEDPTDPVRYDYSNDFFLEPTPNTDQGLQIRKDNTAGCHFEPSGSIAQSQVHRWVTDPMPSEFKLTGKVTLKLHTRTIGASTYRAGICVFLFRRHEVGAKAEDKLFADKVGGFEYWRYRPPGVGTWPTVSYDVNGNEEAWPSIPLSMELAGVAPAIAKGDRLGVAITVNPADLPATADGIGVNYDYPDEPSRIEVETTTPLDGS